MERVRDSAEDRHPELRLRNGALEHISPGTLGLCGCREDRLGVRACLAAREDRLGVRACLAAREDRLGVRACLGSHLRPKEAFVLRAFTRRGTAGAETSIPCAENPELSKVVSQIFSLHWVPEVLLF